MLGKMEGRMRRGWQRTGCLDSITDSIDMKFEQTLGDSEGQGSLACFSPWDPKQSDINNDNINQFLLFYMNPSICPHHSSCKIQTPSHSLQGLCDLSFLPSWPPFTLFQHSLCTPQPLCPPSCSSSTPGCFHSRTQWESPCEPSHNWLLLIIQVLALSLPPLKSFPDPCGDNLLPPPTHGVPPHPPWSPTAALTLKYLVSIYVY